ncbi:MAG: hypothetical protein H7Z20_01555 [Bdellovibrio sp.]|nr:hypothetical protein [Methylotenera sp.]
MPAILPQAIQIKLMTTQLLLWMISGVSIACSAIILLQPIALVFKLGIIALILLSSAYYIARDALLLLPWSWQTLEVNTKGELTISNKRGQQFQPALASSTFIHAAGTLLNVKGNGLKLALPPIILMTNANNRDELRRLRVWLRWFKLKT